ncbi:hypothetical protein HB672_13870 [Gaetbulibacter sp. S0825]|nr:hypothetical protein [Gaetbulibacter sp. S0825]
MENKTSKYFKYAIGEIILVIIGILMALQINNWNIESNNKTIEKQLLISLQKDFTETKDNLQNTIKLQSNVVKLSKTLMQHYITKNIELSKDSIYKMLTTGAQSFWRIEPTIGTYQSMLGSGDSKLIQSQKLVQQMTRFYGEISYGFEDHDVCMDIIMGILNDLAEHITLANEPYFYLDTYKRPDNYAEIIKKEIKKLYDNHALFVKLDSKVDYESNRLDWQMDLKMKVEDILTEIEKELENHD